MLLPIFLFFSLCCKNNKNCLPSQQFQRVVALHLTINDVQVSDAKESRILSNCNR